MWQVLTEAHRLGPGNVDWNWEATNMRIATFNVENLFRRPSAMSLDTWSQGKPILTDFQRLCDLIGQDRYTASVQRDMVRLLVKYKLHLRNATKA